MKEITSIQNNLIKETAKLLIKKYRKNLILIEGKKSTEEAIQAKLNVKYIFASNEEYLKKFDAFETYLVTDAIMKKISSTESAPEIVAVVEKPEYKLADFKKFKKIVLLDGIKDAGNFGTIIRACCAFDIDGIFLFEDCTDEFSPKTIRSAAGNMFKIPVLKINYDELIEFKKSHKFISTVVNSKNYLDDLKVDSDFIVMFGSEAKGLSKELLKLSDLDITIKMTKNVESLNLALSCGIVLYRLQFA